MKKSDFIFILLGIIFILNSKTTIAQLLTQEQLVEDAKQMVDIIESCHPDPYINTNGKIGFHLSFYELLKSIPEEGMASEDFWWLLSEFLAKIEDGHTYLYPLKQPDPNNPGGIPLHFKVLADSTLVVSKICNEEHESLIGCMMLTINNVEVSTLLKKVASLYPMENLFDKYRNLNVYLWYADYLKHLILGWEYGKPVEIEVQEKNLSIKKINIQTGEKTSYKTINTEKSSLTLPSVKKCDFVYDWIGPNKDVCYLRIEKQDEFREYAEQAVSGLKSIQNEDMLKAYRQQYLIYAHQWHSRFHGTPGPDSLEQIISELPSFTEFMRDFVKKLKESQTENLVIDLSNNNGGVSLLSDILGYFLFGKEKLGELHADSYDITFLSPMAINTASSLNTEELNKIRGIDQQFPLQPGDYDFYTLNKWEEKSSKIQNLPDSYFESTPTFLAEYITGNYSGYYCPKSIYVIGSDKTFSAGFETLVRLVKCGATFVGVPPAQSGNCFGMGIEPANGLTNSKIRFQVSVKKICTFPEDKEKGYQLNPDIPIDYKTFEKYKFDPNTSILTILDRINS